MRLIIGARGAGKLEYVKSLGYGEDRIAATLAAAASAPVVYRLEELVRQVMAEHGTTDALLPLLHREDLEIIICDEVGSGVVPIDPFERAWRDAVGRLCCGLAARAARVDRVIVGIPVRLK